ncbi:bryoporin-like [Mastacembelus armatus]|uniref:bryoporin-like n=1 Tax=Mastacembelus armatus TaxID=205130 RepID=UPI000E464A92|nr:bryoporin-like [Mastacembelus armatus]
MADVAGAASGVIGAVVSIGSAIGEAVPTHRQCTIELKNNCKCYSLCNPRMYFESGGCAVPPSPFIESSTSDMIQFCKTPHAARGAVGVFTYELLHNDTNQHTEKIAVMYSVPYDFSQYSNWYAVGVFDKSKECDRDLYYNMYNNEDSSFIRAKASDPCLIYEGKHVTIRASMSDTYQPIMKLHVTDKIMCCDSPQFYLCS